MRPALIPAAAISKGGLENCGNELLDKPNIKPSDCNRDTNLVRVKPILSRRGEGET